MKKRGLRVAHLALAMSGKLVFNRAYTWAEKNYPVATPRSLQRIGSVSKALTAIAILQQRSRLADGLNTPLLSALGLPTPAPSSSTDPRLSAVRVEHLLRHRSGWGGTNSKTNKLSNGLLESVTGRPEPEPGDLREYLRKTPAPPIFVTNPGGALEYNNWNFVCLSEIVSALFLKDRFDSYVDQMRQRLFEALEQAPHVVTGWNELRAAGDVPCHPRLPGVEGSPYAIDGRFQAGGGFWVMTARDLVRLISRLDPSSSGGPILDDADVPLLWEPYLVDQVGRQSVYDSGNGRGWSYEARRFPGYFPKSGTVLLKNGQVEGGGAIAFHFVPPGGQLSPSITGAFVVNSSRVMTYENVVDPILNIVEALSPTDLSDVDLFSIP
jgi:CubicO group peptidase (beta-lactamase class C family)